MLQDACLALCQAAEQGGQLLKLGQGDLHAGRAAEGQWRVGEGLVMQHLTTRTVHLTCNHEVHAPNCEATAQHSTLLLAGRKDS